MRPPKRVRLPQAFVSEQLFKLREACVAILFRVLGSTRRYYSHRSATCSSLIVHRADVSEVQSTTQSLEMASKQIPEFSPPLCSNMLVGAVSEAVIHRRQTSEFPRELDSADCRAPARVHHRYDLNIRIFIHLCSLYGIFRTLAASEWPPISVDDDLECPFAGSWNHFSGALADK